MDRSYGTLFYIISIFNGINSVATKWVVPMELFKLIFSTSSLARASRSCPLQIIFYSSNKFPWLCLRARAGRSR